MHYSAFMDCVDLNLLTALDVLLTEGSVTGAARRFGLSSSPMSAVHSRGFEHVFGKGSKFPRSTRTGSGAFGTADCTRGGRNQPRMYLLNQSIVRCQARSAAALLYRSGVASQLKPCTAPG